MRGVSSIVGVGWMLLLAGCHLRVAPSDAPAVLTSPSPPTHAELVRVVSAAMNGAEVRIADTALTEDDVLIVERAQRQGEKDMNLGGRETGRPHHFRLVKSGPRCVLVHQETGRRWTLESATCSVR